MSSEAAKQQSASTPGSSPIELPRGVNTLVPEQFDLGSLATAQGDENEKKFKEIVKKIKELEAIIKEYMTEVGPRKDFCQAAEPDEVDEEVHEEVGQAHEAYTLD